DWSSDVCSSDLRYRRIQGGQRDRLHKAGGDRTSFCQRADLQTGEQRDRDRSSLRYRAKDQDLLHNAGKRPGRGSGRERQAGRGYEVCDGIRLHEKEIATAAAAISFFMAILFSGTPWPFAAALLSWRSF